MKNLENFGVQELDAKEIKSLNGGIWNYLAAAIIAFAWEVTSNPKAHLAALESGYNSYQSNLN